MGFPSERKAGFSGEFAGNTFRGRACLTALPHGRFSAFKIPEIANIIMDVA
jgi:hypothetical protein